MRWLITLILALIGVIIALTAGFAFQNVAWITAGVAIAVIALLFRRSA